MKKAAVIGDPIGHSLSPQLFSFVSKQLKIDLEYRAEKVTPADLQEFFKKAQQSYVGLNVTIPHKEKIVSLADEVSQEVEKLGAANVVHFLNRSSKVHNTDVSGIADALSENGIDLEGKSLCLIGAGGAARAMAYVAGVKGAKEVLIFNRTEKRARHLSHHFGQSFKKTKFKPLSFNNMRVEDLGEVFLFVNSTSVGMQGASSEFGFHFEDLLLNVKKGSVAFDMVYRPSVTPFLRAAQARGVKVIGGIDMLIYQALSTWEIWFGKIEKRKSLKDAVHSFLIPLLSEGKKHGNLFLTGFMGAGKTTVGKRLSIIMGWPFVDTDDEIQRRAGKPISKIFEEQGEAAFRSLEAKVIEDLCHSQGQIIALGGGALTNRDTLERVQNAGWLVYLSATILELVKRLESSTHRPLLKPKKTNQTLRETIEDLFGQRAKIYGLSDYKIETDGLKPEEIAKQIRENFCNE